MFLHHLNSPSRVIQPFCYFILINVSRFEKTLFHENNDCEFSPVRSRKITLACTTFVIDKDGHIIFGRNYDWISGAGIVHTNQRGLFKTSMKSNDGGTISWISKFGSITFNQYGKEFPTGGMNEKGLVVELMWLDGARYSEKDAGHR